MYGNAENVIYFDSLGIKHIPKKQDWKTHWT